MKKILGHKEAYKGMGVCAGRQPEYAVPPIPFVPSETWDWDTGRTTRRQTSWRSTPGVSIQTLS